MRADDPRHGTLTGYTRGCREDCCRRARRIHETRRRLDQMAGNAYTVDATGTHRRIRALSRLGWTQQDIADAAGWQNGRAVHLVTRRARVNRRTAQAVERAYKALSMTLGPSDLTRRRAARMGWPPPLAWDDIDDPAEVPNLRPLAHTPKTDVDEVVVLRVMAGERLPMTTAERREVVARLRARGWSLNEIEMRCGIGKPERYMKGDAA